MSVEIFSQIRAHATAGDVAAALALLAREYRERRAYAELFEVLKMQARQQIGLPLVAWREGDAQGSAEQQARLEQALYRACEEVGEMLFVDGRPALAWKYFQLVGNRAKAAQLLRAIPVTQENLAELIHVAADASVDPVYGLELTIEHQGLCNGITLYDRQIGYEARPIQSQAASVLVAALSSELVRALRQEIEATEGRSLPPDLGLADLIADRPWLCAEGRVHVDVSHLASVVRIAKVCTAEACLIQARNLCDYGNLLDPQLRGGGDPPFADHFGDHRRYYAAVTGSGVNAGLEYFRNAANAAPQASAERRAAWEVVAAIHVALRQDAEALAISLRELDGAEGPWGLVPAALELASRAGRLPQLAENYATDGDLLMFSTALLLAATATNSPPAPSERFST